LKNQGESRRIKDNQEESRRIKFPGKSTSENLAIEPDDVVQDNAPNSTSTSASNSNINSNDNQENSNTFSGNFAIEGKWKSVGDTGNGQAQPGAIVIFDGNYCNFISPKDTYAFYKENNTYKLDVTTVLGSPSSYTVHIIDENNIQIMDTTLKRVS
jgi:hypothetical protein